jgi:hypothetical protein
MKPIGTLAPFELSETDREVLATKEGDFVPHNWEELQDLISMTILETED